MSRNNRSVRLVCNFSCNLLLLKGRSNRGDEPRDEVGLPFECPADLRRRSSLPGPLESPDRVRPSERDPRRPGALPAAGQLLRRRRRRRRGLYSFGEHPTVDGIGRRWPTAQSMNIHRRRRPFRSERFSENISAPGERQLTFETSTG